MSEKSITLRKITRELMSLLPKAKDTDLPYHPKHLKSSNKFLIIHYYFHIVSRAAHSALDKAIVNPERKSGRGAYLYSVEEAISIIEVVKEVVLANQYNYDRVGLNNEVIEKLKSRILSQRIKE